MTEPQGASAEERPWERVHTVFDYYDGPRVGFADFDGMPHAYNSIFREDLDDWDPDGRFELSPVGPEVFALAMEHWEMWLRWADACNTGRTPRSTHPVLPDDRARYDEIHPIVEEAMKIDPARRRVAIGDFRRFPDYRVGFVPKHLVWYDVRWTPAE